MGYLRFTDNHAITNFDTNIHKLQCKISKEKFLPLNLNACSTWSNLEATMIFGITSYKLPTFSPVKLLQYYQIYKFR
ncbi:unnamed protein product [Blumeria hordei]|uniref:Uncharacterized protein n=1 Tax=Blumeria hordei TaxID=2867405 RepID=A0A383UR21_BLUHO|nr:unnamed protein product [Blumeria hordei]